MDDPFSRMQTRRRGPNDTGRWRSNTLRPRTPRPHSSAPTTNAPPKSTGCSHKEIEGLGKRRRGRDRALQT